MSKSPIEKKLLKWKKRYKAARKEYRAAKAKKHPNLQVYKTRMKLAKEKFQKLKDEQATAVQKEVALLADNLTKIEGIGPKIAQVLNNNGIDTFRQLSRIRIGQLKIMLYGAGQHYNFHNPATWATQARLASAGRWDDLELLQKKVKLNRRPSSSSRAQA